MNSILKDNTALNATEFDRLVGTTIQTMRRSLNVTTGQLAKASGMPRPSIEAIERGCAATRGERHDIVVALGWLSNNRVAKGRSEAGRQGSRPVGMRRLVRVV